jgi:hypothetical protein
MQAKTFFEVNLCVLVLVVVNRVKRNGLTVHLASSAQYKDLNWTVHPSSY